ncbi:MAG: hypothetical protein EZS28_006861 [Streblomastix strix]|uniref:Uncharacterized protein n=1 Tax=Streblomastix strix TaxID=222440 RepID=A0A5J4WRP8_9EUKA|nr:MAG: hypothetical protein EZS28_006861 [Streblomastix strix]
MEYRRKEGGEEIVRTAKPIMIMEKFQMGMGRGQTVRYMDQLETIFMKDFIQQGFTLQWKDSRNNDKPQHQLKIKKFMGTEEEEKDCKIIITLPVNNGPSESISSQTGRMKCNVDNEQENHSRYRLVCNNTQCEHSSMTDIDAPTNDNDNGCSTKWMGFNYREGAGNDSDGLWNLEQKYAKLTNNNSEIKAMTYCLRYPYYLPPSNYSEIADALSILSRAREYKLKEKMLQQTCLQMNLNPAIDLFSQHFNKLLTKIQVNNKKTRRNCNRRSKLNLEDGTSMDSSSYPSPSSSSEEDQRRADRSNDNCSTMARLDVVYRTGIRECSILMLGWSNEILEPRTSLIKKNLKLVPGKICCFIMDRRPGREDDSQEKFFDYQHIILTEVIAQFTSVNTSASSAVLFLNGLSSMLLLTFDIDLKNNHMFQFTRKAISAHMIVKPKYEEIWNVGILFDYWREKGSNRNLTNNDLQTKPTSLLMTICSMRPAQIE